MKSKVFAMALVLGLSSLWACGDDDDAPASTTTLTTTQAESVAEVFSGSLGTILDFDTSAKLPIRVRAAETHAVSTTKNCDGSGTKTVTGETNVSDESETSAKGSFNVTETYTACLDSPDSTSAPIITGSVNTTGDFNLTFPPLAGSVNMKINGSVDVSGDGVTGGTCGVSVNVKVTAAENVITLVFSGSVCGTTVSGTTTENVDS